MLVLVMVGVVVCFWFLCLGCDMLVKCAKLLWVCSRMALVLITGVCLCRVFIVLCGWFIYCVCLVVYFACVVGWCLVCYCLVLCVLILCLVFCVGLVLLALRFGCFCLCFWLWGLVFADSCG